MKKIKSNLELLPETLKLSTSLVILLQVLITQVATQLLDVNHLLLDMSQLLLVDLRVLPRLRLGEASSHHVFDPEFFHAQEV